MELRQLEYFIAIVDLGTITGAARALNMSQPPLSAQMHALEGELGCALFEHVGRRLRVTEAGRALYARARAIVALCRSAAGEMADLGAGASGVLRLGVISSVCGAEFARQLSEFSRAHPGVRFDLREANTYQLLDQLRARALDLAIVRTPFTAPDMAALPIRREPMLAVGRAELFGELSVCPDGGMVPDPAAGPAAPGSAREESGDASACKDMGLEALGGAPIIVYRRWEGILRDRFERLGLAPRIVCVNDNAQTSLALAREGMGIALVPASTLAGRAAEELERRQVRQADMFSEITAVYPCDMELTSLARRFLDGLRF